MVRVVIVVMMAAGCSSSKPAASTVPPSTTSATPAVWVPTKRPPNASLCVSLDACLEDAERAAPLACERIGDLVDNGALALVTASDLPGLETRLDKVCRAGDAHCCAEAAKLHCDPPGPGSWNTCRPSASGLFELGCTKDDAYACMGLSIVTRNGLGVTLDEMEAQRILDRATARIRVKCDRGDVTSCGLATQLLYLAHDDPGAAEASRRFNAAMEKWCAAGDGLACAAAGRFYGSDEEDRDEIKSQSYLQRACTLGVALQGCPRP